MITASARVDILVIEIRRFTAVLGVGGVLARQSLADIALRINGGYVVAAVGIIVEDGLELDVIRGSTLLQGARRVRCALAEEVCRHGRDASGRREDGSRRGEVVIAAHVLHTEDKFCTKICGVYFTAMESLQTAAIGNTARYLYPLSSNTAFGVDANSGSWVGDSRHRLHGNRAIL